MAGHKVTAKLFAGDQSRIRVVGSEGQDLQLRKGGQTRGQNPSSANAEQTERDAREVNNGACWHGKDPLYFKCLWETCLG